MTEQSMVKWVIDEYKDHLYRKHYNIVIDGDANSMIAYNISKKNSEKIAKEHNSFGELLASCEEMVQHGVGCGRESTLNRACAVIAKAKGKE